jgi:WD40 repeat protein
MVLTPDGSRAISASEDKTLKVWDLASGAGLVTFFGEGGMICIDFSLAGMTLASGGYGGGVYYLHLENVTPAPPVLTAWYFSSWLLFWKRTSFAFGCSHCRTWSEIPKSALGTEIACPHCGKPVRLNPFTIQGDWRPVAKAWKGS